MPDWPLADAVILVVDDQESNLKILERLCRGAGYEHVTTISDSREAIAAFLEIKPDLVLLDLAMPHVDGFEVMAQIRAHVRREEYLPILVLTTDVSAESRQRALSMGAKDFVNKPFDRSEVELRIRNMLETRFVYRQLRLNNEDLEVMIRERTSDLEEARLEILSRLAVAAEYRDYTTGQHTRRVGKVSALMAQALGLGQEEVALIERAATLHDVGKIGVPDQILLKGGRLTPEEFALMRTHTAIGGKILGGSQNRLLQLAEEIAHFHHEHWDGTGYSRGLAGEAIPLSARIVAIADVYDSLTHERPYKRAWTKADAVAEITGGSGSHFDPDVVGAFMQIVDLLPLADLEKPAVPEPEPVLGVLDDR
ncbi:MAG: response regulator [Candidatus Dormibacteraeota bacterium]|nr:response regulator [Candidatus Dormibacteraeota bacterium]